MLNLTARGQAQTCDGITRRDFLQVGTLGAIGLSLPELLAAKAQGAVAKDHDERSVIMIFNLGAPSQLDTFDMKPEAPAEIRGPFKPIKTNVPGIEISEIFPLHGAARRQVFAGPQLLSHGRRRARHGAPDDANRPAVHRRHQHTARRLRAELPARPPQRFAGARGAARADGSHGRQSAARPGCRLPGQGLRPLRVDGRSVEAKFQGSRPAAAAGDRRSAARAAAQIAVDRRRFAQRVRGQRQRQAAGQQLRGGLPPDDQPPGPRGVRPVERADRRSRALRHEPLRPVLPAGAAVDRGRRSLRDGEYVPDGLQRNHLGHSRLEPVHVDRGHENHRRTDVRPGLLGTARRS